MSQVCANCGYNLAGLNLGATWECPECGGNEIRTPDLSFGQAFRLWFRYLGALASAVIAYALVLLCFGIIGRVGYPGGYGLHSTMMLLVMPVWFGSLTVLPLLLVVLSCCMVCRLPRFRSGGWLRASLLAVTLAVGTYGLTLAIVWFIVMQRPVLGWIADV